MDWRVVSGVIALVNVVVLCFNAWVTLRVQLAMAQLEKRIAEQRSEDREHHRQWVEEWFQRKQHHQHGD